MKAAQIKSYIKKSYDKTSVGKAIWKQKMMTALMYGKQVITLPKHIIQKLQTIENGVFRYLIGVAGYGAVAAIRGEVGASRVETRVMETILLFAKDTLTGRFEKVKDYMDHEKSTGKGNWTKTANNYREEIGVSWEQMLEMDRRKLKLQIREWDNQKWLEEVLHKPTLKWYREGKLKIQYDYCYSNSTNSDFLAKARTNTLHLRNTTQEEIENTTRPVSSATKLTKT